MSAHFDYLRKVHDRALDHAASLVRTVAAKDWDFIRAYAMRACLPQSAVSLLLSRCIARELRFDVRRDEIGVHIPCRRQWISFSFKSASVKDATTFAAWIKRETRRLKTAETGRLYFDELKARRHARVMAKLRKAVRDEVIARADKAEGKITQEGGAS